MPSPSTELLKAIAVTAELCSTTLTAMAARTMADDLAEYPERDVFEALRRCRRELTGRLSIAAVLERLPNGHPGPEEAWAMVYHAIGNEQATVVLTDQMRTAFWSADALEADPIAARMAFLEVYRREIAGIRTQPHWGYILGFDTKQRRAELEKAQHLGRLTAETVAGLLTNADANMPDGIGAKLLGKAHA